ncbi:MAG: LacI family transcriptional regulator [Defluviitaleaceae bacterium]|nr:LacI family transcriptional regulator [Defluviitaleaceae bacterium]
MATLKDIAREAGVSVTTVSNVINKKFDRASPDLVKKIQAIAHSNNYVPSMTARTLAGKASPIIGVINHTVPRKGSGLMADPFHNIFIDSIERYSRARDYFIMVRTVEDAKGLETVCRNWNLAGIILVGMFRDIFFETVRKIGIPYVLIDSYVDLPEVCNVGLEDQRGGYLATRHLLENGHRTIAFTSPPIRENGVVEQRLAGYKQALAEFGVSFDPALVYEQEIGVEEGIKLGRALSERKQITGIFATADILAAGIVSGLGDKGIRVPEHKSIVGFDDNYLCQITSPRLTTIHQSIEEKGIVATEMMANLLAGKRIKEKKRVLPVRLVERESVANIGKAGGAQAPGRPSCFAEQNERERV